MKQRTFQACSLKHSTKKGMFYVQSKLNYFKSGRGGVLPPPSPPPALLGYASVMLYVLLLFDKRTFTSIPT